MHGYAGYVLYYNPTNKVITTIMYTMDQNTNAPKTCSCNHHKVLPIFIIIVGFVFLLADLNILTWGAANLIWPIALIVFGFMRLFKGKCKCCQKQ
jgi:hypothetical protein